MASHVFLSRLNLIVLRSPTPESLAAFYENLGLTFERHRHGKGPEHFAAELGPVVFEIYPISKDGLITSATRIGFAVLDVDAAVERLISAGGTLVTAPADSPWGRRAVLSDPDGHRVELTNSEHREEADGRQ